MIAASYHLGTGKTTSFSRDTFKGWPFCFFFIILLFLISINLIKLT